MSQFEGSCPSSIRLICFQIFFLLIGWVPSVAAKPISYKLDAGSSVIFEVNSTLHLVHGAAHEMTGTVDFDPDAGKVGDLSSSFIVTIPVSSLDTGNKARDKNMMKMFEGSKYSEIVWQGKKLDCKPVSEGAWQCLASGVLTIHGVSREMKFPVMIKKTLQGLRASAKTQILTRDYGLNPPSVMGIIKVSPEVRIQFQTEWQETKKMP